MNHLLYKKTPVNSNHGNNTTEKMLETFLRISTHCKYNNYIKQWTSFSKIIGRIEVSPVLDFLSRIFGKGHAYSTINSAKCAIATIVDTPLYNLLNKYPLINKYMTGVYFEATKAKIKFCVECQYFCAGTLNNKVMIIPYQKKYSHKSF